jgi:hypothetical protein
MLRSYLSAVVALVGLVSSGSALPQQKESYLFVQGADVAVIKVIPTNQEAYQITMTGVRPEVIFFTDRPQRKAGMIDEMAFMAVFAKQGAKNIQPNAALVWNAPDRGALIVKLTKRPYSELRSDRAPDR